MLLIRRRAITALALAAVLAPALSVTPVLSTSAAAAKKSRTAKPKQPMTLVVDLRRQRVRAYAGTKQIWSSGISSGKRGHRTPTGVFSIIQKRSRHFSNLYNNAPMPHMQRLTWSGIAFHGGPLPGYPASHGCVRLPYGKARQLFRLTRMSTRTIVTYASPRPTIFSHAKLWNKLPAEALDDEGPTDPAAPTAPDNQPKSAPDADLVASTARREGAAGSQTTRETVRQTSAQLVSSVLGVSEAHASTTAAGLPDRPALTQQDVQRRMQIELATSANTLALSETRANVAKALVTAHTADLVAVNKSRRQAVRALAKAKRTEQRAKRAKARAEASLKRLLVRNVSVDTDADRFERLSERETTLEDQLADVSADWTVASTLQAELTRAIDRLATRRRTLMTKLKAARLEHRSLARAFLESKRAHERVEAAIELHERPVHVLISRTKSKIYMRQGYKDVFEADIEVANPDAPIGTHVLTVIDEADDGETLRWTTLTVPDAKYGAKRARRTAKKRRSQAARRAAAARDAKRAPRLTARRAMDRIVLPAPVQQRLRELVKVGSSVIISDRGPSHETGKGTDFVVLTR
ncbi:MAG: L,D-transpeptidase family protein [Pseudomonadota bacterium]